MTEAILVVNAGSATVKFSLYSYGELTLIFQAIIDNVLNRPILTVKDNNGVVITKAEISQPGYESGFRFFLHWISNLNTSFQIKAVGHRIVHGGTKYFKAIIVTESVLKDLSQYIPLAPIHQPQNLEAIRVMSKVYPEMINVGCFDTAFHRSQEPLFTWFAIPREYTEKGVIRYGFHGLSYEYIASILANYLPDALHKKVVVAHLGNGASMCALYNGQSVATSMGFTALDGLMMGTRCGTIDPGVLLYFQQEKKLSIATINQMLYKESGLLGVSGLSSDMRELCQSQRQEAMEAVDLFCYRAGRELTALLTALKGFDALVFTAGIGENSSIVRQKICHWLTWLGVELDEKANNNHSTVISAETSKISVLVLPTNEELMIAQHTKMIARH